MELAIQHRTTYRYARPVVLQPHRMLLRPRDSHDVTVLAHSLHCSPVAELDWAQDVFGNLISTGTFAQSASELIIDSRITLQQSAAAWPVFKIAPSAHSFPFQYSPDEVDDLGSLRHTQHDDAQRQVQEWARGFVRGERTDTLSLLKDINAGILRDIEYRTREEEGTQAPIETLSLASGSCRDIAALFLEAVRSLGFAARAVSGYLFDPQQTTDDAGTTHAWAEIYLPAAGWIAFDPTHQRVGSGNLIAVAVGRCNRQIMPVTGGYLGAADDFLGMEVAVSVDAS